MSTLDPIPSRPWIYVLELVEGNYYVGVTKDLCRRFEEHWTSRGSQWTRQHTPTAVYAVHRCCGSGADATAVEKQVTLDLMRKMIDLHGREGYKRVRGGPFCGANGGMPQELRSTLARD